jgi:hypothetical protein
MVDAQKESDARAAAGGKQRNGNKNVNYTPLAASRRRPRAALILCIHHYGNELTNILWQFF